MFTVEIQLNLCQLTSEGFMQLVEKQRIAGNTLEQSYLAIERFHEKNFGERRYSGFGSFQRVWYTLIEKERKKNKLTLCKLTA